MKKLIIMILAAALLFSVTVCANAAEVLVYEDTASGNTLTIPEGWDLEYEEDGLIQVTFLPGDNPSALMQYGSMDSWNRLSADSKAKTPRSSYDNRHVSVSDVAELVGCTAKDVKRVTLKATEYYRASFEKTISSGKLTISLDVTCWVRYENGWLFLYQYVGSESNGLYKQFKDIIASAVVVHSEEPEKAAKENPEEIYQKAVASYESGDLEEAQALFQSFPEYEDSSKYLRLLRIRDFGGNTGMGSDVYKQELGLTEENKKDIDDAAADFDFADTAQVLLCNSDVASYYLEGSWTGGTRCFLYFKMKDSGGTYSIGSKLSSAKSGDYSIQNGEMHTDVDGKDTVILKLSLTQPNTLSALSYEMDEQVFTLERKQ